MSTHSFSNKPKRPRINKPTMFFGHILIFLGFFGKALPVFFSNLPTEISNIFIEKDIWFIIVGILIYIGVMASYIIRSRAYDEEYGEVKIVEHEVTPNQEEIEVEWEPVKSGGANFKTHTVKVVATHRLEFPSTIQYKLFGLIFILMGSGIPGFISYAIWRDTGEITSIIFPALFGLLFVGIGVFFFKASLATGVLDSAMGWYWKGNKKLNLGDSVSSQKDAVKISDIKAVQLLGERISSRDTASYTSTEINLVLKNGDRINIMDHGDRAEILDITDQIAGMLKVPVLKQ